MSNLQDVLENATQKERFKINDCIGIEDCLGSAEKAICEQMKEMLSPQEYAALKQGLIRNSFLIEPVNDEVTSTKVECRWSTRLMGDCRYADFNSCYDIFKKLLLRISNLDESNFSAIRNFLEFSVIPYELPIDYIERRNQNIHSVDNIDFFLDEAVLKTIKLRKLLFTEDSQTCTIFKTILSDKIKVKTYLTDRALTGEHKTNREKRWEVHPDSVQYALRRICFEIETTLLLQAARFQGCDSQFVQLLTQSDLLERDFELFRCPITGEILRFEDFSAEVLHPTHGKSRFQVGHLNPLKATTHGECNGHSAANISWISENGNRIQGSLSMEEVDRLLKSIYRNRPELRE